MRQPFVAGNWKMNGSLISVRALIDGILQGADSVGKTHIAVCPPFVYLHEVSRLLRGTPVAWGAQNMHYEASGAFTGDIAANMLLDFDCRYVILGHSERRALFGESDEFIAKKTASAIAAGLVPILCVGELLEQREQGRTHEVVAGQIDAVLDEIGIAGFSKLVLAYEPVWAIGTGMTATPEQAQEVHAMIRQRLAGHDAEVADKVQILYGGSVKASNAAELFAMADIDGGLIGGASLDAQEFLAICRAAG